MTSQESQNPLKREARLVREAVVAAELPYVPSRLVAEAFAVINKRTHELVPDLDHQRPDRFPSNGTYSGLGEVALPEEAKPQGDTIETFHFLKPEHIES